MLKQKKSVFSLIFLILVIAILSFALLSCKSHYGDIAEPTIRYSEFPIRIEYKINDLASDEVIVIEDTLICEYKGILVRPIYESFDHGPESYRVWNGNVNYTNSDYVAYTLYSNHKTTIEFVLGEPGYYMGDSELYTETYRPERFLVWEVDDTGARKFTKLSSIEELEIYGIEIINYILPKPIENTFQ